MLSVVRPAGNIHSDDYLVIGTAGATTLDAGALDARSQLFASPLDRPLWNVVPAGALLASARMCHLTSRVDLIGVLRSARYAPSSFSRLAGGSSPISRFSRRRTSEKRASTRRPWPALARSKEPGEQRKLLLRAPELQRPGPLRTAGSIPALYILR